MSYFVVNEGWKNYAHVFNKTFLLGVGGYNFKNTMGFRSVHKFMDGKFFNHLFDIGKINDKVYNLCTKLAKPINVTKEKLIDKNNFTRNFNYSHNGNFDDKFKFSTTKKIFNGKHENFYLVRFTFDDDKIHAADIIVPTDIDNCKARIINIRQWKTINTEEYLD